ncbi:MAG TPA: DNA recombination protein RmuC [Candidatus Bathyarchaeia archaeon]|nr:DNA recombination protein RmuC [Candidatus Bathyarchaeia archaeon]
MEAVLIGVVLVVGALVLWLVLQNAQEQKKSRLLETQMNELRRDLLTLGTSQAQSAGQIATIGQSVSQRLESVTKALQDGVSNSAHIASQGQTAIANELKNTREQIGHIQKQLGEVQEAGRGMSLATKSMEAILGGAKSRGLLGEVTLERLLEDSLPHSQYQMQYRFSSGETADAVIFLRDKKRVAIDSKFPLESYRRIETDGQEARRAFVQSVKGHAESISKKYIVPAEGTLDLALMFVPSENVYCELLTTLDAKGEALDSFCRSKNIIAVSPNTLYAHLCVIHMGLRGMQIEENARRIAANLSGMQKQLENFSAVFEKLGNHLKNAQQSYGDADRRLEKTQNTLENLMGTSLQDPLLEDVQLSLLPPEAKATKAGSQ